MRTKTHITIEQLEGMKTHELADLLSNVAMLLRRMPDVACGQLTEPIPADSVFMETEIPQKATPTSIFTEAELKKKKKEELQKIAKDLFILCTSKTLKEELISKILTRAASGHSEQYAIRDV